MSKIILASQSKARKSMLHNAGIYFTAMPADLDENSFHEQESDPIKLSLLLATEKALHVSQKRAEHFIIGSDQVLEMNGKIYSKAQSKKEAIERLKEFSGKTHFLHSSVSIVKNSKIIFQRSDSAALTMKKLSDEKINHYADVVGDVLTSCVGCYAIEGLGINLFEDIKGDFFTIMGMPLLPLLNALEEEGAI